MRTFLPTAVLCLVTSFGVAESRADETLRLAVTRDTWVSAVGQEVDFNTGGSARLKLKGVQEFSIVDIDPAPLRGKRVLRAELHVKNASKEILQRVTVSSLASEWVEGTSSSYAKEKGAASFNWARQDEQPWAWAAGNGKPGSDITAVCLGQGGTIWRFADATPPDKDGWQVIAVDPAVVMARVAGISHGFVLMDDVGSEYERNGEQFKWKLFPNRFIYSHEQSNAKPYFVLQVQDVGTGQAPSLQLRQRELPMPPGEALVDLVIPAGAEIIGFEGRYQRGNARFDWDKAEPIPQYLMPAPGPNAAMHWRDIKVDGGDAVQVGARCFDVSGRASAVATVRVTPSSAKAAIDLPALVRKSPSGPGVVNLDALRIAVVDALGKFDPTTGQLVGARPAGYLESNALWSAADRTIHLHAARNEWIDFQMGLIGKAESVQIGVRFEDRAIKPALYRFRHVQTPRGMLPDPLVPLDGPVSIPARDEQIPDQKATSVLVELLTPRDLRPGIHRGTVTISSGSQTLELPIELLIWDFALPDQLSFIPEMNCYGLPDSQERAYYRIAHDHRTNLNRLGYSWRGIPADGCAPKWDGRQFQWEAYDKRFGPLLDGSEFANTPRGSIPVEALYLPNNENWPIDINQHFKGGYWADQALDAEYEKQFTAACAAFAEHFRQKGWTRTLVEFYLNNKVYYKKDRWSKSSAPWILDEPVNTQDFWALRYYGKLFHAGVDPVRGEVKMAFRCDISYPQRQRDILDGVLDVNICGGAFRSYHRAVMDRKSRNREITFNYGSSNNIEASNTQPVGWCIDTWCLGGDGVLPWQTIGNADSWKKGDALSLFYPSLPGGNEPVVSARLKAYRRGQQDVEYLAMLASLHGNSREAVSQTVRSLLGLSADVTKSSEDDAGLVSFQSLEPAKLSDLRERVGQLLDKAHPAAGRPLIDAAPGSRDVGSLPDVGYIRR